MYMQMEPPPDLKHLISFFYCMEHRSEDGPLQELLPSATEVNGWQYAGRWRLHLTLKGKSTNGLLPEFYLVGQQTVCYKLTAEEELAGIFGAGLHPGSAARMTGKPAHLFANNPMETPDLFEPWVIRPVIEAFKQARSPEERKDIVVSFYRSLEIPDRYAVHREALEIIYRHKACITLKEICEQLRVNERYLQREFRQYVGIPPSEYLRILRFNNIFAELSLSEEKQNIASLASLFHYYDISHFNKTHKKYFGIAPSRLMLDRLVLLEELIRNGPYLVQVQQRV